MTTQIAHEINQPLGAIANFASGLRAGCAPIRRISSS